MDPATIALGIAGVIAALGIKRSARRAQAPEPEVAGAERVGGGSMLPDFASGRALRPAVTEHREREAESADVKETGLSIRARMANAMGSSAHPDVAGAAREGGVRYGQEEAASVRDTSSGVIPIGSRSGSGTGVLGRPRTQFGTGGATSRFFAAGGAPR